MKALQRLNISVLSPRPDGMGTVTEEEKEQFDNIRDRLLSLLENQIVHFRCQLLSLKITVRNDGVRDLFYSSELLGHLQSLMKQMSPKVKNLGE